MQSYKMKSITWHRNDLFKKSIKKDCIILLIGMIYLVWYQLINVGIPCVFHTVTGLYCPGCGVTRMFSALSKLEIAEAFRSNSLVLILIPYGMFVYVRRYVYIIKGEEYNYKNYHRYILTFIVVLVIVFGIARNIPYFYFLRPEP